MPSWLLCDATLRVEIDGGGERTLLMVTDGSAIRFWTETALLESALEGDPVQLSSPRGYCLIEVKGSRVKLSFGLTDEGVKRCEFPTNDFAAALDWVRHLDSPTAE